MASRTLPQYVAALSASSMAFAAGTVLGWTSPVQIPLRDGDYGFEITDKNFAWIGSILPLGAALACVAAGVLINIIGRKITTLVLVIPFIIGWLLLLIATNVPMMIVGRFVLGMAAGGFCVSVPIYIGEIANKDIRGKLGSFFQLLITIGILFVYAVGAAVKPFILNCICFFIPIIFGAIFLFMPESPTYLVKKNNNEKAVESIKWLRGSEFDPGAEMAEIQDTEKRIKENPVSLVESFKRPVAIKSLCISLGLMIFQQLSGINAYIFYTTDIFEDADTGFDAKLSTIIVGVIQVIATFIAVMFVDNLGRRILLTASAAIMALSNVAMGLYFYMKEHDQSVANISWLPVLSLCVFIVMFSFGFGPVPWLMVGELFASEIKGTAGSIAGTLNWLLAFLVTQTFVYLKEGLGTGQTFWLFAIISVIGTVFVILFVPETKGKTLNEIQELLGQKDK